MLLPSRLVIHKVMHMRPRFCCCIGHVLNLSLKTHAWQLLLLLRFICGNMCHVWRSCCRNNAQVVRLADMRVALCMLAGKKSTSWAGHAKHPASIPCRQVWKDEPALACLRLLRLHMLGGYTQPGVSILHVAEEAA